MLQIDSQSISIAVKSKSKNVATKPRQRQHQRSAIPVNREFQITGRYDLIIRQRVRRCHLGFRRSSTALSFLESQKRMNGT
jgi:hypothetical protein